MKNLVGSTVKVGGLLFEVVAQMKGPGDRAGLVLMETSPPFINRARIMRPGRTRRKPRKLGGER